MNATRRARALKIDLLESLDKRITPAIVVPVHPAAVAPPVYAPNGTFMDKMGRSLNIIYQEYLSYQNHGGQGAFVSSQSGQVIFGGPNGTSVAVNIRVGNLNAAVSDLKGLGMQVGATNASTRIVTGYLPISRLSQVASNANVIGLSPITRPILLNRMGGYRLP